ncbi:MAG: hypothetical protein M1821_000183 [Bathelium mastoideum]|nr:MAG: hypothetical protein M1821_000183 [Bathelium mastoideum]
MTTAPSDPPIPPPHVPSPEEQRYNRIMNNAYLFALVACPAIIALPPRKLDVYTFGLGLLWISSADSVAKNYTGLSLWDRVGRALAEDPARAAARRERLEAAREARMRGGEGFRREKGVEEEDKGRERSLLRRIWMGGEGDDWKEKRMREEREAMEEGKGYGEVMMDQIRGVWADQRRHVEEAGKDDGDNKS